MFNKSSHFLTLILILAFLLRVYKLNTPLADWHSWRQADTASVAREFVKHGIDLFHPRYQDLSAIPSGKDNPEGFRMVEFPLLPALVAIIYSVLPIFSLHVVFRLVNIFFSLGSVYLIYRLVKLFDTEKLALIAAAVFAFLPYNVFYSRTVLPEIALVFFSLAAVYFALKSKYLFFLLTAVIALLLKPTAIFFFIPVIGFKFWLWLKKEISYKKLVLILLLVACSLLPLFLWRLWISRFPEGIPASSWLLNGNGIRFKGSWWHWLFADRLARLILGYWGLIPFALGLLSFGKKSSSVFYGLWLVSCFLYLAVFATGNVQHDYYQIILIPLVAILVALGFKYMLRDVSLPAIALTLFSAIFMLAFGWFEVRGFYNVNNSAMVEAGQAVDQLTPPDALVIAPYQGDTAFLYQTNRRGWPIGGDIETRIKAGASYYVTTSYDAEAKDLAARYQVIEQNPQFTLIKLVP